jgi:hypothetical protein
MSSRLYSDVIKHCLYHSLYCYSLALRKRIVSDARIRQPQ